MKNIENWWRSIDRLNFVFIVSLGVTGIILSPTSPDIKLRLYGSNSPPSMLNSISILSNIFKEEDGSVWSSFDSVLRPPEIHEENESTVPGWALSLAWTGVSITVLLTIIGAFVLRRDRLT